MRATTPKLRSTLCPDEYWEQRCSCANNNTCARLGEGRWLLGGIRSNGAGSVLPRAWSVNEANPGEGRSGFPQACVPPLLQTMPISQLPKSRLRGKHAQSKGLCKAGATKTQTVCQEGKKQPELSLASREAQPHSGGEQTFPSLMHKGIRSNPPTCSRKIFKQTPPKTLRTWLTWHQANELCL